MTQKRDYEKPAMKVVKLQQKTHLLAGSEVGGTLGSGWTNSGGDAWNDSGSSGSGGSLGGGWTNSGGDAWE